MARTTAVEFQRRFGEFQHKAAREPVEITRHGRREFVLLSADHYDRLVALARRAAKTEDASAGLAEDVLRAEVAPEPPVWEVAEQIAKTVPDEVWDSLPTDLAANYKHYLSGRRKTSE